MNADDVFVFSICLQFRRVFQMFSLTFKLQKNSGLYIYINSVQNHQISLARKGQLSTEKKVLRIIY